MDQPLAPESTVAILLVRGEDPDGHPIYAYVAVRADIVDSFLAAQKTGTFYPEDYGVILESGKGEPSPEVKEKMETEYGFDHKALEDITTNRPSEHMLNTSEIYEYYKELFHEFEPYYMKLFDSYAKTLSLSYNSLTITIDEGVWNFQAVVRWKNGDYIIHISKGLFLRLIFLVNCLIRPRINLGIINNYDGVMVINAFDMFFKNPDFSFYDNDNNEDLKKSIRRELHPVLFDYDSQEEYEFELHKYWSGVFSEQEIRNRETAIPFFWVLDFVIYHEMSHVLLGHLKLFEDRSQESEDLKPEDVLQQRYMEGHADYFAAQMLGRSLQEIGAAAEGAECSDKLRQQLFSLSFLADALFIFWGQYRQSITFHASMAHPHFDFRRRVFREAVGALLGTATEAAKAWYEEAKKARFELHKAYNRIGAHGLEYSIFQESLGVETEVAEEWVSKAEEEYAKYCDGLNEFSMGLTLAQNVTDGPYE